MAKRLTDTGKWDKAWFRKLKPEFKCIWIFLCDRCDHAGIWDIDDDALAYFIGKDYDLTIDRILEVFGEKVRRVGETKLLIKSFVDFQYGDLNPANRVHKSVLVRLEKQGAYKGLNSPYKGAKDIDKDKDKDKDRNFGSKVPDLDRLYSGYPRKQKKTAGLKRLLSDLKAGADIGEMFSARDNFIAYLKRAKTEANFIPYFSTWANEWREWLDPNHGTAENFKKQNISTAPVERLRD